MAYRLLETLWRLFSTSSCLSSLQAREVLAGASEWPMTCASLYLYEGKNKVYGEINLFPRIFAFLLKHFLFCLREKQMVFLKGKSACFLEIRAWYLPPSKISASSLKNLEASKAASRYYKNKIS